MTHEEFRAARQKMGLSARQLAELMEVRGGERTIYKWERKERAVPGPVAVLLRWLAYGERPGL